MLHLKPYSTFSFKFRRLRSLSDHKFVKTSIPILGITLHSTGFAVSWYNRYRCFVKRGIKITNYTSFASILSRHRSSSQSIPHCRHNPNNQIRNEIGDTLCVVTVVARKPANFTVLKRNERGHLMRRTLVNQARMQYY